MDGSGQETKDGETGIEGDVGVLADLGVDLTTSTERVEGVEHAGAAEAYEADGNDLSQRRGPAESHCFGVVVLQEKYVCSEQ